jgi:hypothetical protein
MTKSEYPDMPEIPGGMVDKDGKMFEFDDETKKGDNMATDDLSQSQHKELLNKKLSDMRL